LREFTKQHLILVPTIAARQITFGILQQILTAFGQVSSSFQYLVNSWTTIVELESIHKRLAAFEAAFEQWPITARNRSDPSLSCTPMGFAALYPSYPKTTGCRMG
jgi:ABC-type long-subunit fatty acid transport system fused permease/ATPase subunit